MVSWRSYTLAAETSEGFPNQSEANVTVDASQDTACDESALLTAQFYPK